jgi:hypothetical protein
MRALLAASWLLFLTAPIAATYPDIYPEGHFDYVTQIRDVDHLNAFVSESIQDKTAVLVRWIASSGWGWWRKQAPAWNIATRVFQGNKQVVFADVNLQDASIRGEPHNPGAGGWPTVRYFTKATGLEGADYEKKTDAHLCVELGDLDNMMSYIEEAGNTVLCGVDGTNCNDLELAYVEKMKTRSKDDLGAEKGRLENMEIDAVKESLQDWNYRRRSILRHLIAEGGKEEDAKNHQGDKVEL